jgi:hypothetical protein
MIFYRALRDVEVELGNVLIPKSQEPFLAHPKLPHVVPFLMGKREEHAVRDHQWNGQYLTRGVSCTLSRNIAIRYAATTKVIVEIDEAKCVYFGIRCYRVCDYVPPELIIHPDDGEIILVSDNDGAFPKEIITDVFELSKFQKIQNLVNEF